MNDQETITISKKKFMNVLDFLAHGKHPYIGTPIYGRWQHFDRMRDLRKRFGVTPEECDLED